MLRYTHVRETRGYNRSPDIDRWNRTAGVPLASSYCEAFGFACFEFAARALNVRNPFKRTASVSQQLKYAAMIGSGLQVIPISTVVGASRIPLKRGDALMAKTSGSRSDRDIGNLWPGHRGTALGEQVGTTVRSIEANTSPGVRGSQRDGDGVHKRNRPLRYWLAAVRVASQRRSARALPVRLRTSTHQYA